MFTRKRKLLIVPALLLVGIVATASGASARNVVLDEDKAIDTVGNGVVVCNGGVQEQSLVVTNDAPTNIVETAGVFTPLPFAAITVNTPANDADQLVVTFTAEARLLNQLLTYAVPTDFIQIRVMLDGVQMNPVSDMTFTTDTGHANAMETCKRMPAVNMNVAHLVTVEYLIVDQPMLQALTGTIDDWTLHVEVNN
ncbi:hypothetical protein Rhe02_36460 [Rhizocola hellebori]|uniref:Uncharacterized protein n=1 Tax=Rhizocola hellebori TaxID=1392758 RepID=A0A8J3Q7R8_9ACTN|nr:hypothetical protein [Rhizocola hellebori]GIH05579.1 hypothetical protein Rhe02_36460 [Rhizocola hellebori]